MASLRHLQANPGASVGTVSRYLALMEQTHVLRPQPSYAGGKRREVTSARKGWLPITALPEAFENLGRQG